MDDGLVIVQTDHTTDVTRGQVLTPQPHLGYPNNTKLMRNKIRPSCYSEFHDFITLPNMMRVVALAHIANIIGPFSAYFVAKLTID